MPTTFSNKVSGRMYPRNGVVGAMANGIDAAIKNRANGAKIDGCDGAEKKGVVDGAVRAIVQVH